MTITIKHGVPSTPYFLVAYPKREYEQPRQTDGSTTITLIDENKQQVSCSYFGCFEVPTERMENVQGLPRLTYGCSGAFLKENMLKKYPELKTPGSIIEFWILKRL